MLFRSTSEAVLGRGEASVKAVRAQLSFDIGCQCQDDHAHVKRSKARWQICRLYPTDTSW